MNIKVFNFMKILAIIAYLLAMIVGTLRIFGFMESKITVKEELAGMAVMLVIGCLVYRTFKKHEASMLAKDNNLQS
ncbi:hypothetical protein L1267_22785 [Pseudoalteromonas sp. OFAV1]|uniref:hypothetical protein n=1 Tax=Pseudoalteromonas sp. OFAV1 TaxID=2908892 RepID=UPI001F3D469F|nr:hypothetical protein [Pseudoalteromonas sp. OFAV1]MCF2903199.1 hypothetical protein [Pseudoalteromonas sp. OFAV1]